MSSIEVEITIKATFETEAEADDYYCALKEKLFIDAEQTGTPKEINITSDFA